ncbi:MAG TPA: alpha/beta hydrolase [Acidimicrobiales bacterium]|nr:alpha/beta hydrolase [Acidimicrobiales bacterium]
MSRPQGEGRRRRGRVVALGAGAAAVAGAAGWALQHRAVSRSSVTAREMTSEGLTLPDDLRHHFVDVDDGGRIHVVERGQGPPLVLLHGFMLTSAIWVHQLRDLADHHRIVAVDLRGHGQSLPGSSPPGIGRLASDVRAVMETLGVENAVVVGHSMGGMVALRLADDLPLDERRRRVAGIVLVSTTAGPFATLPGWTGVVRVTGPVTARALLVGERWGAKALPSRDLRWWLTRLGFGADAPAVQVRFVEAMHRGTPSRTLADLIPSLATFDLSSRLGSLDLPVLVVVGSHDKLTAPRLARRMAGALPEAQLVELPRCGHMPMLERRHEFSRLVDEFTAKIS